MSGMINESPSGRLMRICWGLFVCYPFLRQLKILLPFPAFIKYLVTGARRSAAAN